jgi:hypothetical protein
MSNEYLRQELTSMKDSAELLLDHCATKTFNRKSLLISNKHSFLTRDRER